MSVQKLKKESSHYAQILNDIIIGIKDNNAFRLYCFLYSKSEDWVVVKSYALEQCGISEKNGKRCFSYLARCGLISKEIQKDSKGQIEKHYLVVLNGTKFDPNEPFLNNNNDKTVNSPQGCKSTPMENHTTGKIGTTKERSLLNKKETKTKEQALALDNFSLPEWLPVEVWDEFKEHRHQLKKPMTKLAQQRMIKNLEKMREEGFDVIPEIEKSIRVGWLDVFRPDKKNFDHKNNTSSVTKDKTICRPCNRPSEHCTCNKPTRCTVSSDLAAMMSPEWKAENGYL